MIKATIVADSKNEFGNRLTTFVVTFPRPILAELNTHRMFSRNSASSRAIPFEKMVESVKTNPFVPLAWQVDHKGMQGTHYLDPVYADRAVEGWLEARDHAVDGATHLNKGCAVTKQLCNRLLEPFMYHTAIISATEFENFFALRCPQYVTPVGGKDDKGNDWVYRSKKDVIESHSNPENLAMLEKFTDLDWLKLNKGQAEIHIMALAEAMWDAYNESTPKELKAGEWHIPYEPQIKELFNLAQTDTDTDGIPYVAKVSAIMCARVSYTVLGTELSEWTIDKYVKKSDELSSANPLHASPFEHPAECMDSDTSQYKDGAWSGNFHGFIQYRKMLPNENRTV